MYNTSTNYKLEIKKPSRAFECRVTIGSNVFVNDDIVDIILETTQPQDGYSIGCTPSQTLDLTIINKGLTIYSTNKVKVEIGLKIGASTEYILMGYYNVDDVVKTDYSTKFTCYDNMIKFEIPYFSSLGDTPSLTQVVNELATMTGVQFTGSLPSYTVKKLEGFTCREVLSYVASICGGNALITRDGKFTIAYLNDSGLSIGTSNYIDYKREEVNYKIGKVSCQVDKNIITKGSLGTDSMELQFENPWITESILNDIYNRVKSIEYLGYTMKWQGDLSLDPGDLITITDIKGIVRKVPVLSQKFTYTGGLTSEIGGKGESKNKNSFSSSGSNSNKVNRVVTELLIVNEALINKANIKDLEAVSIRTQTIEASVANINHIFAGNITADMIQVGTITAGSGIIANGAIGDLQVSTLSANKLTAGKVDTSLVEVSGANGRLTLKGNRLQVFDSKNGTLFERLSLGDVNNDGTKYGLRVRGADGTTILFDENGQTKEGFSDGYNKLTDNSLDSKKLDINSVVRRVNGATEKISSTVVQVGDKTLDIKLSEQTNTITSQGTTLTSHEARISASENSILLKVDTQTYTTNNTTINTNISNTLRDSKAYSDVKKTEAINSAATDATNKSSQALIDGKTYTNAQITTVNTTLNKATSDISVMQGQIALKVEQTDIDKSVNNIVIGGSNLIENTKKPTTKDNWVVGNHNLFIKYSSFLDEDVFALENKSLTAENYVGTKRYTVTGGIEYTFSMKIYIEPNVSNIDVFFLLRRKGSVTDFDYAPQFISAYSKVKGFWLILTGTMRIPTDAYEGYIRIDNNKATAATNNTIYFTDIKLEIGNKVTDYSPSTKDVDKSIADSITIAEEKIKQAKAEIKIDTDNIKQTVSGVDSKVTTVTTTANSALANANTADGKVNTLTTTVTATNNKVTTIEANLNRITSRVSATENFTTTLNGKITSAETRITSAEQKITATSIVNTINESINNGTTSINTVTTTLDKNGFTIKNGAIKILNKYGTTVLSGDINGNIEFSGTAKSAYGDQWVGLDSGGISFQESRRNEQLLRIALSSYEANRDMNGITFAMPKYSDFIRYCSIDKADLTNGWQSTDSFYNFFDLWSLDTNLNNSNYYQGVNVYAPMYFRTSSVAKFENSSNHTSDIVGGITWNNMPDLLGIFGDNGLSLGYKEGEAWVSRIVLTEGSHPGTDDQITSWGHWNGNGFILHNFNISARSLSVSGSKNCIQSTENYGERLINAYETAEYYFGDLGFGKINTNGECYISIDDIFQECVNTNVDYHIFIQAYNGVTREIEKHSTYFIVKGDPLTKFSWEIKAKRIGYENNRLDTQDDLSVGENGIELFTDEELKPKISEKLLNELLDFRLEDLLLQKKGGLG